MKRLLPELNPTSAQIALKTCLALVLDFGIALWLDWKPSFGAIVVVVVQTPALGATFKKGLLYITATLFGAVTALAMIALFAHDRVLFIAAMALLTGFCIYRMQGSRNPYLWLIYTVTSAFVGWVPAQNTSEAFGLVVMRSSTVGLAIVIAFFVHGIIAPITAGKTIERQLHAFLEGCRELVSLMGKAPAGDQTTAAALKRLGAAQVATITALHTSLDAAAVDTERFKRFQAGYLELINQLRELLLSILAVHDEMARPIDAGRPPSEEDSDLRSSLRLLEGQMAGLVRDLGRPRDATAKGREPDALSETLPDSVIGGSGTADAAHHDMIAAKLGVMKSRVSQVRASLACVEDPGQVQAPLPAPARQAFSWTSPKFKKAAQGSLVVALLAIFFILTQWPRGLSLGMTFGTIAIAFGGMLPLLIIRRQLLLSLVIGPAIAAPLYFGIMPRIDRYEELIPWICIAFLPLLYMQTSRNPKIMIQSILSSIFLIALLSLDEERQSYSFSSFLNMWLAFCGGFTISLALYSLFSAVVPEREFWKQVRSFFAGCSQFIQGLEQSRPGAPARAAFASSSQARWLGTLKQLQTWSSAIRYETVPGNDRQKTQALIESIERLALRLGSAEPVRHRSVEALDEPLDEPLRKLLGRIEDACVESLQLISSSLADLKPIPELPDTSSLVQDIEARSATLRRSAAGVEDGRASTLGIMSATAGALAESIRDCRDKSNALDWVAWHRNTF